jgi:hypothetical protein
MHPLRALSLTLGAALFLVTACSPGEVQSQETQPTETSEAEPIPEGMEDWAYLLGHTTPFESNTEWDGDQEGFKTEWYAGGSKSGEGEYRDSKRVGPWTFWHENGHKRWEGTYIADLPEGLERGWYEDGTPNYEGSYESGLRQGAFSFWYPSGQLWWKGSFEKGKRDGVFMQWKADGSIDTDESGIYENGTKVAELDLDQQAPLEAEDVSRSDGGGPR